MRMDHPMTKRFLSTTACALLLAGCALAARADAVDLLRDFVRDAKSGQASFTQTVTSPDGAKTKTSSGSFEFSRPNRFRFEYRKPFEQTIVGDGRQVWLYDADLNQVTERGQAQVLGQTPAALIAEATDLRALQADFTLAAEPARDGLQWVKAVPKTKDGQLQQVQVGFDGDKLAALEILDSFGQRSVLKFGAMQLNPQLPAGAFEFKPPAGADVLKQ